MGARLGYNCAMRPYMIAIAGFSGSGKTTLARRLAELLPAAIFSLDAYYRDHPELSLEERRGLNYDHPESLDAELIAAHLRELAEGREVLRPVYDFAQHARSGGSEAMQPAEHIIVEGLFPLHWPEVRNIFSTKVFLEADHNVCLPRREARDVAERGRSPDSVRRQYAASVQPMAEQFIRPSREHADLVLGGTRPLEESVAAVVTHIRGQQAAWR